MITITDPQFRARFVELLRASAAELTGDTPPLSAETRSTVRAELSRRLTAAAQSLCDHASDNPDGSCRYCNAPAEVVFR